MIDGMEWMRACLLRSIYLKYLGHERGDDDELDLVQLGLELAHKVLFGDAREGLLGVRG